MKKGRLTTITGCMFSGKTTELLRRVERAKLADREVKLFKPDIDKRYSSDKVCSHSGLEQEAICIPIVNPGKILEHVREDTKVVAIEEVQFFSTGILSVTKELIERGIEVFICGLDLDFKGELFGSTYLLMAFADYVEKLTAICMVSRCGNEATRTQRLNDDKATIVIGETDKYEARCRDHYIVPE